MFHHVELWVGDLTAAEKQWGPVLLALGCTPFQHWEHGRSWRKDGSYLVIEQSSALRADHPYDRMRAGLNHLALCGDRQAVAAALAAGWTQRVDTGQAVHVLNDDGFELEIQLELTQSLPAKRMGSDVLFTDVLGRALLVEPTYKDYWEIVGGAVELDESPYQAAIREAGEELGIPVIPGRLLVVDWVPPQNDRTEGVMYVYDGGILAEAVTAAIQLPREELRSWAWCTAEEAASRMPGLLARRVAAALRAKAEEKMFYLENGFAT